MSVSPSEVASLRRVLGNRLRILRANAGKTGLELSIATGIHQTRLSRIEHGKLVPREDELEIILKYLNASPDVRDDVLRLAKEERISIPELVSLNSFEGRSSLAELQEAVWRSFLPYKRFRWIEISAVPGILEILPYVEHMFSAFFLRGRGDGSLSSDEIMEIKQVSQVRTSWQHLLFDQERQFEFVLTESAISIARAPMDIMAMQCSHLLQYTFLPNVSIGLVPNFVPIYVDTVSHSLILDEELMIVEHAAGQLEVRQASKIRERIQDFEAMQKLAVYDDEARELFAKYAAQYASRSKGGVDLRSPQLGVATPP